MKRQNRRSTRAKSQAPKSTRDRARKASKSTRSAGASSKSTRSRARERPAADGREDRRGGNEELLHHRTLLQQSHEHFLELYDLAPVGFLSMDNHGTVGEINLAGAAMLGTERARILGMPFFMHVRKADRRDLEQHLRLTKSTNATCSLTCELGSKGGGRVIHMRSRRARTALGFRMLSAIVDASRVRDADLALGMSDARLRIALTAAGAGMWDWDWSTKRLRWSEKHYELLRLDSGRVEPSLKAWAECVVPDDRPLLRTMGLEVSWSAKQIDFEYRIRLAGGGERWLRTMGRTLQPEPGGGWCAIGITMDITSLKNIERRLTTLNAALGARTAEAETRATQLRELTAELARAESRERARIAEFLHDEVQQVLVAADLKVARLLRKSSEPVLRSALDEVASYVHQALRMTRGLSRDFDPRLLEKGGFRSALEWQAESLRQEYGLLVRVDWLADVEPTEADVRAILLHSVREMLFNIVKHAHTGRARIHVTNAGASSIAVEVTDRGSGFDLQSRSRDGKAWGQGIHRIRDRISALGGTFEIESRPGEGTRVRVVVDIAPPAGRRSGDISKAGQSGPDAADASDGAERNGPAADAG